MSFDERMQIPPPLPKESSRAGDVSSIAHPLSTPHPGSTTVLSDRSQSVPILGSQHTPPPHSNPLRPFSPNATMRQL